MLPIRRINILAGPGAGKSTLAARLFGDLRSSRYDIEYINEYVKSWVYQGKMPQSFDQLYIFSKQLHNEEVALKNVKYIVTDSPLFLNMAFTKFYGLNYCEDLMNLINKFEELYPSLNLFLDRTIEYVSKDRYQDLEQAKSFDSILFSLINEKLNKPLHMCSINDYLSILNFVKSKLNE